ncbi:MAG TPA: hypothetical protein VJP88_08755 [Caulobacteraceae bacterium]|nr:hypothetical protein [Caulobacteraceae bacterium]
MIREAEEGGRVEQVHLDTMRWELERAGVRFVAPGRIEHEDGRLAPTRSAVGKMTGRRLQRARRSLGMAIHELASETRLATGTLIRLEALGELRLTAAVYAAVGALQLAGYRFAPNHGDKRLGERRRPLRPWEKDIPIECLGVGLHVRGVDDEFEDEAA